MTIRVGVDVGGTFTKAVAFDLDRARVVAQSVLPTTHTAAEGVAAGVVAAVAEVAAQVGASNIDLVTHSTTQAVNALLEGDVAAVGVVGLGRRPELKQAQKRTELSRVELSPGKFLKTLPVFFDVTDGLDRHGIDAALDNFVAAGAASVCVAEAFAPDDSTNEQTVATMAASRGLPACASSELTGLYGLELRAVTAAVNASITPIALRTAGFVEDGVRAAGIAAPVMVMRGDGGATDLAGFRTAPARTLYSGPAASVAGALRFARVTDAVVVEVGGTSTNVAAVRFGRPALSYVQVASHATALRAVDVRVIGVAGGSMLRVRRNKVYGVGPRSAHIAGLPYATFTDAAAFAGAKAVVIAPRAGDPADYLVIELADGSRVALTNTCAANALGVVQPGDYAVGSRDAALAAFAVAGAQLRLAPEEVARRMLEASGYAVAELIEAVAKEHELKRPVIVAVGGGAGGLGRHVAAMLRLECQVPDGAEVISSLGDALSLVRAERERTMSSDPTLIRELIAEVEAECLAAGASPASLDVRVEEVPEKSTVRAVATGAIGLASGAVPGREPVPTADIERAAGGAVRAAGAFFVAEQAGVVTVVDRFGDVATRVNGETVENLAGIEAAIERHSRHRGPVVQRATVWVIDGAHVIELSASDSAVAAAGLDHDLVIVGRGA
ncbi:MAG: hydantoinase/oxoprolinase family protein [Acidimicrobiia bacterium]